MTITELKTHIESDPNKIGLSFMKQNNELEAMLNTPDYGDVDATQVTRGALLLGIAPAIIALSDKPEAIQRKWDRLLNLAYSAPDTIDPSSASIQGLFGLAVRDGLMDAESIAAIRRRRGTYAEFTFGAGTTITRQQLAEARS